MGDTGATGAIGSHRGYRGHMGHREHRGHRGHRGISLSGTWITMVARYLIFNASGRLEVQIISFVSLY